MMKKGYNTTLSEQLKENVMDGQEGRGPIREPLGRKEKTSIYDRGVFPQNPTKGARNTEIDQQRQEEKRQREEAQKELEMLALYDQVTNPGLSRKQIERGIELTQVRKAKEEANRKYEEYINSPEYAEKKNKAHEPTTLRISPQVRLMGANKEADEYKNVVAYYENQEAMLEDRYLMEDDLEELATWDEEGRRAVEEYLKGNIFALSADVFPGAGKYGAQRIKEMAESLYRYRNQKAAEMLVQEGRDKANEGFRGSALGTAEAIGNSLLSTVTAPLTWAEETRISTGRYHTLDPNAGGRIYSQYSDAIIGQVAENIRGGEKSNFLRKMGAWAYQGSVAAADNLLRIAAGGGTKVGTLGLMAVGTFDNTLAAASARGASPEEAVLMAVSSAGIEVFTEKMGLDELFRAGKSGLKGARQAVVAAMRQGGVEVAEEEIAFLSNLVVEAAVLQEKSSYNQQIGELVANGMSYDDAKNQANLGLWEEALDTAITSYIAGNVMSGAKSAGRHITQQGTTIPGAPGQVTVDGLADDILRNQQENAPQGAAPEVDPAADFNRVAAEVIPRERAVQEPEPGYSDDVFQAAVDEMTEADLAPVKNVQVPIQKDMPENARFDALKDRIIAAVTDTESANHPQEMGSLATLKAKAKSQAEKIIRPLVKKLGILNRSMTTPELEVDFQFSNRNLSKSMHSQMKYGGDFMDFAKTLVNLDKVLENAVLVERHSDKYTDTIRSDENLEEVAVLLGAFRDGMSLIPVQIEIKKTSDSGSRLYMTVAMTKIEADVLGTAPGNSQTPSLLSAPKYNIADIFGKINPQDAHFLKYVPDQFLTEEQIAAKQRALAEDVAKIQRYRETGQRGGGPQNTPPGAGEGFEDGNRSSRGGMDHGSVGADTTKFRHETRRSKVYDNTYANATDDSIWTVGQNAERVAPGIADYEYISEEESLSNAEMRTRDKENRDAEYAYLIENKAWTGEDNDTAMRILKELQAEGDIKRFRELAKAQRERGTTGGQFIQSFAKYTRDATTAVVDAINTLEEMTRGDIAPKFWRRGSGDYALPGGEQSRFPARERKQQAFDQWKESVEKSLMEVGKDIDNIKEEDPKSMREAVRQLARMRKTTAWFGASSKLTKNAERILNKLDYQTAKSIALAQLAQMPNDFRKRSRGEVIKAVRFQNMLSSLTTVNRNLVGNATTGLIDAVSDSTSGRFVDMMLSKVTGKRTVGNDIRYGGTYLRAARDAADMASLIAELDIPLEQEGKYVGRSRTFSPRGNILSRFFSAYEKYMNYALQVTDEFFSGGTEGAVIKSLEALGEKSGLTEEEIAALGERTGRRRTFKEGRAAAKVSTKIKEGLNEANIDGFGAGDLLLPFAEVPADMGHVAVDYSVGVVEGFAEIASIIRDARNGKEIDVERQRKAATDFGRGVTGPVMIAMFTAFAAAGIIAVHDDEDQDKRALEQSMGLSGAQINLSAILRWAKGESTEWQSDDLTMSIDFLQPFNSQMYIGWLLSQEENVADMLRAYPKATLQGVTQSILDIPMMGTIESIADLLTSFGEVSEGDFSAVEDAAGKLIGDQASSFIPAWLRQTAQYIDPVYRDTTGENPMDAAWNRVKSSIPFLSKTLPAKLDGLGNEQRRYEDPVSGFFNTFVNPGALKRIQTSDIADRLEEYGDKNLYPEDKAPGSFMVDGKKVIVSGKEMTETYQKTYGENISGLYGGLMDNEDFNKLPEEAQIAALKQAKTYATQLAKASVSDFDDVPEGTTEEIVQGILHNQADKLFTDSMEGATDAWKNGKDDTEAAAGLEEAYQVYKGLSEPMQETVFEGLSERVKDYIEARDGGQEPESYMGAAKAMTLAEHHIDALRDAWKEGEDGSATFTDLDQAYELYRELDEEQRKQVLEMASSKTRHFLEAREAGVNTETYTRLYQQYDQISSVENAGTEEAEQWSYVLQKAVEAGQITQEQADTLREEMGFYQTIPADAKKYDEMTAAGISADDAKDMMWLLDGIEGTGSYNEETKKNNVRPADRYTAIAGATFVSDQEKDTVMKIYMPDYDPTDESPNKTELKYDYARQVFGLTPELYAAAYQIHSDNDKKDDKLKAWQEFGFSSAEANMLYRLFGNAGKQTIDVVAWYEQQQAK